MINWYGNHWIIELYKAQCLTCKLRGQAQYNIEFGYPAEVYIEAVPDDNSGHPLKGHQCIGTFFKCFT
ncbi:hypothetical protein ACLKA6_001495 [Drosophila palustris]